MNFSKKLMFIPVILGFTAYYCKHNASDQTLPEKSDLLLNEPGAVKVFNTDIATIDYENCDLINGCELIFQSSVLEKNAEIQISAIEIQTPNLLMAYAGTASSKWYQASLTCKYSDGFMKCRKFFPIADKFTLIGFSENNNVHIEVKVQNKTSNIQENCEETVCGQAGTTVQRMFDCSKRVKNFAGFGDGLGGFSSFIPGEPDNNWFLVSSLGTGQDSCTWLSPILKNSNPVLGKNEFDTHGNKLVDYMNSSTQGRFLWAGKSSKSYNFFEANGKNPLNTENASYPFYKFSASSKNIFSMNGSIYYPGCNAFICKLPWTKVISKNASTDWQKIQHEKNICESEELQSSLLSGTEYLWQMPSYPMILTLTGGGKQDRTCERNGDLINEKGLCNGGLDQLGFRASDQIPGFTPTTGPGRSFFWSSSVATDGMAYMFTEARGNVAGSPFDTSYPVRCVSAVW